MLTHCSSFTANSFIKHPTIMQHTNKLLTLLFLILGTGLSMSLATFHPDESKNYIPENYQLIWSDEFDEEGKPSKTNWTYDIGSLYNGWGNREVQYYTKKDKNVRVENGHLIINALKDNKGNWTSARVKSEGLQHFKYGLIEFRAKLPVGSGTWPALWMLGKDISLVGWPTCGEIDIMEHVGKNPGNIISALHDPASHGNTQNKGNIFVGTTDSEFHTYAMKWTTDSISFMVDGEMHYSYSPAVRNEQNWPYDDEFFIIMNIAIGGNLGSDPKFETKGLKDGIDPALSSAVMEIDYVRFYQEK